MSIAKKGSRKITVNGTHYRWRVSRPRKISDYRSESNLLSEDYLNTARKYGLGDVADIVFNVPIELYESPGSKILMKYFGLCVDGFLGPEQFAQIKPSLIAEIIEESIKKGWKPEEKGDFHIELFENTGKKQRPAILVLPNMNEHMDNYDNLVKPVKII